MNVSTDRLVRAIKLVTHAAATDEVRLILNGILFEGTTEGLALVAADNYRLARCEVVEAEDWSDFGRRVVPLDEIPLILRTIAKSLSIDLALEGDRLLVATAYRRLTVPLADGTYPDYWHVLPRTPEADRSPLGVNPRFLAETARALAGDRSGLGVAKFYVGTWDQPLIVVGSEGYTEAIMPLRLAEFAAWQRAAEPAEAPA